MSIREYMRGSEDVMFVSDLLKTARPETPSPAVPKGTSIYERVRDEQRHLENEWYVIDEKKKELEAMQAAAKPTCKRYEIRAQREAKRKCEEMQKC